MHEDKMTQRFQDVINRVRSNDPTYKVLDLEGLALNHKMIEETHQAVEINTEIGNVKWGILEGSTTSKTRELIDVIENKIKENNLTYKDFPTDYMHGLLSYHAYTDAKRGSSVEVELKGRTEVLGDWRVNEVFHDQKSGYYGVTYVNDKDHQIVLAHRGTTFEVGDLASKDSSLGADIQGILGGKIVAQQTHAYLATSNTLSWAVANGYQFSTTGHSLGAWYAEQSAYFSCHDFNDCRVKAVTFDSPGTLKTMEGFRSHIRSYETDFDERNLDITTYLSAPNLINICNGHIGKAYRIYPEFKFSEITETLQQYAPALGISDKLNGLLTISGHTLSLILETFDPITGKPTKYDKIRDWPELEFDRTQLKYLDLSKVGFSSNAYVSVTNTILNNFVGDYTIVNVVKAIIQAASGNVSLEQYWETLKRMNNQNYEVNDEELPSLDIFQLKYQGHYDVKPVNLGTAKLSIFNRNDVDVKELKNYSYKLLQSNKLTKVIKKQIEEIVREYELYEEVITSKEKSIDDIKKQVSRLIVVAPEIKKVIQDIRYNVETAGEIVTFSSNLPFHDTNFVGREDVILRMHKALQYNGIAILSGLGGIGKTTIAKEYGYRMQEQNTLIRWFEADSILKLEQGYSKLAEALDIRVTNKNREEVIEALEKRLLHVKNQQFIFIYNNVDDVELWPVVESFIQGLPSNFKFIITTRNAYLVPSYKAIKIDEFTREEAGDYLKETLKERAITTAEIQAIIEEVNPLPYRLNKVVTYLQNNRLKNVNDYLKAYKEAKEGNKVVNAVSPESELLFRDLSEKNKGGLKLLQYLKFLDPDSIPKELLEHMLGKSYNFEEAVRSLEALSLIEVTPDAQNIKIHRLTQNESEAYIRKLYPINQQDTMILGKILHEILLVFPFLNINPKEVWEQAVHYSKHAVIVAKHCEQFQIKTKDLVKLYNNLGSYYVEIEQKYTVALDFFNRALTISRDLYSDDSLYEAECLNNLGNAYNKLEEYERSLEYYEKAYTIVLALDLGDHPGTATTLNNMGIAYNELGDYGKALKYHEDSLAIKQTIYSGNHTIVARSLYNIGAVYSKLGHYKTAFEYYEKAIAIYQAVCSGEQPNFVACQYSNLAVVNSELIDTLRMSFYSKNALELSMESAPVDIYGLINMTECSFENNAVFAYGAINIYDKEESRWSSYQRDFCSNLNMTEEEASMFFYECSLGSSFIDVNSDFGISDLYPVSGCSSFEIYKETKTFIDNIPNYACSDFNWPESQSTMFDYLNPWCYMIAGGIVLTSVLLYNYYNHQPV